MSEFFETAQAIGARLCRDAIWSGSRCNWIGASMEPVNGWTAVQKSFGPDLYSGTSGIGLLLAELAALNNEKLFRRTAEAAAAHALSRLEDIPPTMRLGFYSGHSGIAYALVRMGERLANAALVERGLELFDSLAKLDVNEQGIDVISGVAGAIPSLLLMHKKFKRPSLLDLAMRCAARLEQTAQRSEAGWSWRTIEPATPQQRNLTGFSHGTAGIAWAMLELAQESGERRFQQVADQALSYERRHFVSDQGNWPDFRENMEAPAKPKSAPTCGVAWCHGAPGIGLSRLRVFELTKDKVSAQEAEIAGATTMRYLAMPHTSHAGYSLCHGCAGNADFLLEASRVLQNTAYSRAAEHIGRQGIASFEQTRTPWPCGVLGGGETPNLLLGTAGISLFYLRLEPKVKVAPVLMVGPGSES
jgi:type 2 lantibiotic biosynthesis protein LanM